MGVGYYLQSTFYFTALLYIPVSMVALILYLYPAFVTAGSLALGWERFSPLVAFALSLALTGLFLVVNPTLGVRVALTGVLLAFAAAVTYTLYILFSSRVLRRISGEDASFYVMGFAGLTFWLSGLAGGKFHFAWGLEVWVWALLIASVSTVLPITTFFQGLKIVGPSKASILSILEPVTSVAAASLLFAEQLSMAQWVGGVLILSGTILAALSRPEGVG